MSFPRFFSVTRAAFAAPCETQDCAQTTEWPIRSLTLLGLIVALALIWFTPLGWRHLLPSDEGRYAEMAREMLVTGDWITPRYNGYKYFEKPPLQTWANALTFAWFGLGEWQARFYTALTGFAGVLLIGYTGARVFTPAAGLCAALVLASAPYWYLMGHFNTLDMGLSFWMELTLCAMLLAHRPSLPAHQTRLWMRVCWASMALAVLSKGLIGVVLPGAVLVLYLLIERDWTACKRLYPFSGLILFFAIATPWFVLVQARNPEFFDFFFIVQQFKRYLTPEQHRPGPFYYFIGVMAVGFLPWLSIAFQSVRAAFKTPRQSNGFAPMRLMLIWAGFIFIFFSVSHSKLISYVLPIAPALALLIGCYVSQMTRRAWRSHLIGYTVFFIIAAIGATFISHYGDARTPNALYRAFQAWVWAAIATAFALTLLALWLNQRTRQCPFAAPLAFSAGWIFLCTIAGAGHDVFGRESSGALLAPAVKAALAKLPSNTPFYSVGVLDHTMPFYIGHTMIMVENPDELYFGVAQEPQKWAPTLAAWVKRWETDRYALALIPNERYDALAAQHLPMRVIARDERRVIVEKP